MSVDAQREAAAVRAEWLGHLLSTAPADRPAAEAAISELYRLIGLDPPRFHWVPSPLAALETVPPGVRPRPSETADRLDEWPLPARFRRLVGRASVELDERVMRGSPGLDPMIRQLVRMPLTTSARSTIHIALQEPRGRRDAWYTALCVSWSAHYDAVRRCSGVVFTPEQNRLIDLWATPARSCGWWWPREDVCVVSERPVEIHTEVWDDEGEVRLHRSDGPALRFADGWDAHAWHGTRVPGWVVDDPGVERIAREANVEVRRCAIENIGWGAYIDRAGLRLVAAAPDPGNPGSELRLYDLRDQARVLLAVNGSVERDGSRRRYGLAVPGAFDDPLAAAGWTYGLSADQYARLVRRT
ncbi:DUF6745 domain-containing protein [Actinomadura mexicana]|uniref:DUF6745 domain-containing protein n=1 Tax=Actinomadura mexicana TaxID=134959 RepID=A0A238V2X4_9ACTN|nr:hypothetical protein [Actinomadura mexicana]SNR27879.1 hypothetical protein SAMN06265355_101731 [Actinomadura mexicana]